MEITPTELPTVLAALRYWQAKPSDLRDDDFEHFTPDSPPLTSDEIDALCERLNQSPQLFTAIHTHKFGKDVWPFYSHEILDAESVALGLGIDFEPDKGEDLEIAIAHNVRTFKP